MKIEINIQSSHVLIILLFITAASAIGLAAAYGGTQPNVMGHTWGEMECAGCIINSNLADNSVTGAKIVDSTITNADISPTAAIAGSKITGTVPNAQNAQTIGGIGIGNSLYIAAAGCGGGVSTAATCATTYSCTGCSEAGCSTWYNNCAGTCTPPNYSPVTCSNSYLGKLLA